MVDILGFASILDAIIHSSLPRDSHSIVKQYDTECKRNLTKSYLSHRLSAIYSINLMVVTEKVEMFIDIEFTLTSIVCATTNILIKNHQGSLPQGRLGGFFGNFFSKIQEENRG